MVRTHSVLFGLLFVLLNMPLGVKADILNGNFETGDFLGWTATGNGNTQVLTGNQFAPLGPTQGNYFALISNGPSDVGNDGFADSILLTSDAFSVSSASLLQFDYDFLTAEFTGSDSDPSHLDSFSISLLPLGASPSFLASGDVSLPTFTLIDGGNVLSAPDGSSFIEHTGLSTGTINLGPGTYSLSFRVDDAGDGYFDSALLIDNVRVTTVTTPEPNCLTLFVVTLTFLCLSVTRLRLRRKLRGN